METIELQFNEEDIHAIVESLRDALENRVSICMTEHPDGLALRREYAVQDLQIILEAMASAYTKSFMVLEDIEAEQGFLDHTRLGPEFWDLFYHIAGAGSFDDVEIHSEHDHDCVTCDIIY